MPIHSVASALFLLMTPLLGQPAAADDPAASAAGRKMVVIAPRAFHAELSAFIAHKQKLLPTELVSLETVLKDGRGVDDPERLKRFLYEGWKQDNVGYALLVGDVDVLPVRYMVLDRITPAAFDYAFYPSDLYYGDLAKSDGSFDDWNAQTERFHGGYFGEVRGEKNKDGPINFDDVDYRPEIAVGRWPVRTPIEVRTVAAKTVCYEQAVLAGNKPGLRTAALFAVDGWVDGRGVLNGVASTLPRGWSAEKRYYARGRTETTPEPTEAELYALLSAGVGLVVHTGHGESDRWHGCCTAAGVKRVRNADRLPVMLSAGCSTAHFAPLPPYEPYTDVDGRDHPGTNAGEVFTAPPAPPAAYQRRFNPTGLGEELLRAGPDGAVAYIGCNTGSQPCGLTLVEGFGLALGRSQAPRLGDVWAAAVRHYFEQEGLADLKPDAEWYPPSVFFQGMKFMVFGDPSLRLPGAE